MTTIKCLPLKNMARKTLNVRRYLSTTDHCLETIRKYDYENYVCTLLLKKAVRNSGIAIRAFNVELARLPDQVSTPQIGLLRFKFWEDAIDKCFAKDNNKIPNHPIVAELYRVLKSSKFTKRYFLSLINSRKDIMLNNHLETLDDLEKYADRSVSSVYYLLLEASKIRNVNADHAASHLGKAQGICQLLRSLAVTEGRAGGITLPQQLLNQYGVSHEDLLRVKNSDAVRQVVFEVATRANQHLTKALDLCIALPKEAKTVLLPSYIIYSYLQRLQSADFDLFHKSLQARHRSWIFTVWWKNLIN